MTSKRAPAEDLVAETFVRAIAGADGLRAETARAFLFTITRRLFLQGLRRTKRETPALPEMADPSPSPEQQVVPADEGLAAQAAELRRALRAVGIGSPRARSSDADLKALRKVRGGVRLRGWLLGISIFLTCSAFSFTFDHCGVDWIWSRYPAGAALVGPLALAGWIGFFRLRRRLGV